MAMKNTTWAGHRRVGCDKTGGIMQRTVYGPPECCATRCGNEGWGPGRNIVAVGRRRMDDECLMGGRTVCFVFAATRGVYFCVARESIRGEELELRNRCVGS